MTYVVTHENGRVCERVEDGGWMPHVWEGGEPNTPPPGAQSRCNLPHPEPPADEEYGFRFRLDEPGLPDSCDLMMPHRVSGPAPEACPPGCPTRKAAAALRDYWAKGPGAVKPPPGTFDVVTRPAREVRPGFGDMGQVEPDKAVHPTSQPGPTPDDEDETPAALLDAAAEVGAERERLRLARRALVDTGYFTWDEVGDDVAPRITELMAAVANGKHVPAVRKALLGEVEERIGEAFEAVTAWGRSGGDGGFLTAAKIGTKAAQEVGRALLDLRGRTPAPPPEPEPERLHHLFGYVWCQTCEHTHIPAIPTVTFNCGGSLRRDEDGEFVGHGCGFGVWDLAIAVEHATRYPHHVVYARHHKTISIEEHYAMTQPEQPTEEPTEKPSGLGGLLIGLVDSFLGAALAAAEQDAEPTEGPEEPRAECDHDDCPGMVCSRPSDYTLGFAVGFISGHRAGRDRNSSPHLGPAYEQAAYEVLPESLVEEARELIRWAEDRTRRTEEQTVEDRIYEALGTMPGLSLADRTRRNAAGHIAKALAEVLR